MKELHPTTDTCCCLLILSLLLCKDSMASEKKVTEISVPFESFLKTVNRGKYNRKKNIYIKINILFIWVQGETTYNSLLL